MTKLAVRSLQEEQMDAADLDPRVYATVLADLSRVNRLVLSGRPTLNFLTRATKGMTSFRLLDVGFGHGDMLRRIARWSRRRGLDAKLVGIDLNPRSAAIATAATPTDMPIDYRTGDYETLAGEGFDFVVSSFVAHHMTTDQLVAFLRFMEREAKAGWMINDLLRHRFAHASFPLLARLMGWHRIVRQDGQLSIARSYRPAEWEPLLRAAAIPPGAAQVVRRFPFKLCVERLR